MRKTTVILFLFLPIFLLAQRPILYNKQLINNPQIRFTRLNTDKGLSNKQVTDLLQDIHGFIWISTLDGLNRYDGKTFEVFKHDEKNTSSINSNYILCIDESPQGELFIGTNEGLNKYNRKTNDFKKVKLAHQNLSDDDCHIRQLLIINDSIMWIETLHGNLIKYNYITTMVSSTYKHAPNHQPYYLYHDIYEDKEKTIWLGTRNREPHYLDKTKDILVRITPDENDYNKKREYDVACFYEDSFNNFWITAFDGIYLFDKKTEIFTKFLGTSTWDMLEDKNHNLWFATGNGVMMYNTSDSIITIMQNQKDNPLSISNNNIFKIMEDKSGNLWFATSDGVNIYCPPALPFNHFKHIPGIKNSPEGYHITAVEEENTNLWIGYEKDGLDYFDRTSGDFTHYTKRKHQENSIASNKVSTLYSIGNDSLLIGLWRGIGFNILNTRTGEFSLFSYDSSSQSKDWYNDFIEDGLGNLYIGFWGADGLTIFDKKTGKFSKSKKEKFERVNCSRLITKMAIDNEGTIWFGTTDCGLHRYFPLLDSGVSYFCDNNSKGLISNEINDICSDSNGDIWFINKQLQKYLPNCDSFAAYGHNNGLTTTELNSLINDNQNNIWIGSRNSGLFKFNTKSQMFSHFVKHDGLQSNSFTKARKKLSTGELFFGNTNGFNIFNPDDIKSNDDIPEPFFGRLLIYDTIFSHDLNQYKTITLNPNQKVFTVELLSTDIPNSERYSYQCYLEDYDEDWVDIDNKQRVVRYASVPAGNYVLKYRIGNRKGLWSQKNAVVSFIIKKPFYLTWWFISTVVILLIAMLYFFIKQREKNLKRKHKNTELQQKLFRLQMNPHFIYNSLLAIQNYIFLKNPEKAGNYLSDFAQLFRLILNNSRSEFITLEKEIETLHLYLKMQSLRYPDKFTYNIFIDENIDPETMMIPPMLAQPIIENALEHGLFYKKGKGNINIRFLYKVSKLRFEVEDNGIGLTLAKTKISDTNSHKPSALLITKQRIKILGSRHGFFADFKIEELLDNSNHVKGTKVMFDMPFKFISIDNSD